MMDKEIKEWMSRIERAKKGDADLSRDEDLSIALMNIISLEEHLYFTAMKTGNKAYLGMLETVRGMRKDLMPIIVRDPVGEEWCISKHLLAASMRLIEVGNKEMGKGNMKRAESCFSHAFDLYSLFFAINLKMIKQEEMLEEEVFEGREGRRMARLRAVVKKVVDCCREW